MHHRYVIPVGARRARTATDRWVNALDQFVEKRVASVAECISIPRQRAAGQALAARQNPTVTTARPYRDDAWRRRRNIDSLNVDAFGHVLRLDLLAVEHSNHAELFPTWVFGHRGTRPR